MSFLLFLLVLITADDSKVRDVAPRERERMTLDSAETHARLEFALTQFHAEWQRAWMLSERTRHLTNSSEIQGLRSPYLHCHNDAAANAVALAKNPNKPRIMIWSKPPEAFIRSDTTFAIISADSSAFAVCPSWMLGPIKFASNETVDHDGALLPLVRAYVSEQRATLLLRFDDAAGRFPRDSWIAGQRVRLHADQGNWKSAVDAARDCRATGWYCAALAGYAHARHDEFRSADSAFTSMRALMSDSTRCRWIDVSSLLDWQDRSEYGKLDCAQREIITDRLWWMADPLFRVAGNERLVAQEMRRIDVMLRREVQRDERYSWDIRHGGDALAAMIERYGWPTYTAWGGALQDKGHSMWLRLSDSPAAPPYTTFEYELGRLHTLPLWDAVRAPFESVSDDWRLAAENVDGSPSVAWWPEEHFRPSRRIVQFDEGQTAFFRRQNNIIVATSVRLQHPAIATEQTFNVLMLASPHTGRVDSIAQGAVRGGEKIVLQGVVDTVPTLLAVEAAGNVLDARTRFGVVPPRPLSALSKGEIALSDPVLMEPVNDLLALPADRLLDGMLPNAELPSTERTVRIFWESYGLAAADTVTVAVRVTKDVSVGRLRRIGIALNVATDPANSVETRWTEPNPQYATRTLNGPVPVQMRTLLLNLSALQPGKYLLEVSMKRPNGPIARSQRRFSLVQ